MEKRGAEWILTSLMIAFLLSGCGGSRPPGLGVKDNRLSPCPSSPNCVSSQSGEERHGIGPIGFVSAPGEAMERLKKVVGGMKRAALVRETADYLHVEFRTYLGFVDDAEFLLDPGGKVIHVRSASRAGYWDLGVNRRRIESIRKEFGGK